MKFKKYFIVIVHIFSTDIFINCIYFNLQLDVVIKTVVKKQSILKLVLKRLKHLTKIICIHFDRFY